MHFRLRLALWYGGLMTVVTAATLLLTYFLHGASLYLDVDRSLTVAANHVLVELASQQVTEERLAQGGLPPVQQIASPDIYLRLFDSRGALLAASANAADQPYADPRELLARGGGPASVPVIGRLVPMLRLAQPPGGERGAFANASGDQWRTRLYVAPVQSEGDVIGYVEAGATLQRADQAVERFRLILVGMAVAGVAVALAGGWIIAGGALRPVATLTQTARAIALSRGFSRRLPEAERRDELGRLATAFNEMLGSLEAAYRSQQRFVADASHELRAPLTVLQGNLELLHQRPDMPAADREASLQAVEAEATRMGGIVSDLLALARAEAGELLRLEAVELDRLALDAIRDAALLKPDVRVEAGELQPVAVRGDPDRLGQLLRILLDNATRYTPTGGRVTVSVGEEHRLAVLRVSDTGIGIAAEDIPRIFEPFYRSAAARRHDPEGTGLGLAIARSIVERHGGRIDVHSEIARGTTVTVRLPLEQPESDEA